MAYSGVRLGKRVHASRGTAQPAQVQTSKTSSEQSPAPSKREAPAAPRRNVVYADYPVEEMVEVLGYHR